MCPQHGSLLHEGDEKCQKAQNIARDSSYAKAPQKTHTNKLQTTRKAQHTAVHEGSMKGTIESDPEIRGLTRLKARTKAGTKVQVKQRKLHPA
jgi:hypothetical protein